MPLELRLLGPLEVRREGAPVRLPAKQRLLLAALAVERGRVVSIDRLVEVLWAERSPTDARHALEQHASRLRGLLGPLAAVEARPPGYVLDIDPARVDVARFEALHSAVRDLLEADPRRAAARAGDALALWRGPALADFAYETFAQEEIARLEELRLEVEETRIDAELRLGHSAELVGEVEALVAAAPLREVRRGQLMLALYRAGRQADALEVFTETRTFLDEELGLEPSRELRDLQQAILRQDPLLTVSATQPPATSLSRRRISVVTLDLGLPLDLDPEEHDRLHRRAAEVVARVAGQFGAERPDELVLAFVQEDHVERAGAAAGVIRDALDGRVGVASGDALVAPGVVSGPLIERARRQAGEEVDDGPGLAPRRVDGPFVGRTAELSRLRGAAAALVVGPPGIGKSRLAGRLNGERRVVIGRCPALDADTLAPLREIAAALGEESELDRVPAGEVPLAFRLVCERAAPVLVVFDDVQWASELVLETIEQLVERAEGEVRILCLGRDELLEEPRGVLTKLERLELGPLPDGDATALAAALGASDVSLVRRAEGNPLFIEQLLAHAAESSEPLPPTLQTLLASRLDRLAPIERLVVERAAIAGREFDAELVARLLDWRSPRRALLSLVRRGLIEQAPATTAFEERFRFRHGLIHEAAYQSVPRAERSRLHEALADVLEERSASDELVGFHLEQAAATAPALERRTRRLSEEAGRRLASAGIARWKQQDDAGAMHVLERAAQVLPPEDAVRPELLCELAVALNTTGHRERALEVFGEAARSGGVVRLRAELERAAVSSLADAADVEHVLELAASAIPVFEAVGDDRALGRALMLSGWVRGGAFGRHEEWLEAAERALVFYRRAGWPTTTVGHIAAALYFGPTPAGAAIERCLALLEFEVADLASEASVHAHLGGLHAMACDVESAERCLEHARAIYTDLGRAPSRLTTWASIDAYAARLRGDLDAAAARYRATCKELIRTKSGFHLATQAAELADLLCELDLLDEAETWARVAETHARPVDRQGSVSTLIARSQLLSRAGRREEAEAAARAAVELAELTDELNLRGAARRTLALVLEHDADELGRAVAEHEAKGNAAAVRNLGVAAAATSPVEL